MRERFDDELMAFVDQIEVGTQIGNVYQVESSRVAIAGSTKIQSSEHC